MPSNKETLFQEHICLYLQNKHNYISLSNNELQDKDYHIIEKHLIQFIKDTQETKYSELEENYKTDTNTEIIKALKAELSKKALWIIIRNGLTVKTTHFELYKPKPRSTTGSHQLENYKRNIFSYKKEYYYNKLTKERIDIVIFLNGLPIVVIELKHEDEGQNCEDAIYDSFLKRDLSNRLYKDAFLFIAASNTEIKTATNPADAENFKWFNANLVNEAETKGEYPVEHLYRYALEPDNILKYLEYYLVFVPAKEKDGVVISPSFTIFPRYHQIRASKNLAENVSEIFEKNKKLGKKYLINHSAGSGKTLTIAWMADLLDGLYNTDNEKVFDNIIILTDRRSLDKNVKDDLEKFEHLKSKINFAKRSDDLAKYLEKNRDIIVTTIHKFSYIQDKLSQSSLLKTRRIAFLIDEAHRSQDGKMALQMQDYFTEDTQKTVIEDELPLTEDSIADKIKTLDISNQIFVAFTATTTPKTVSYFGEPFDTYSEEEAITEGYILDVAHNIFSYETLYHLKKTAFIPNDLNFPTGVIKKALKNIAFSDESLIQYKSEVIVKMFEEKISHAIAGKGKAMVVASSRPAGLKYFDTIKSILKEKNLPYKVLFAFSDYTDPITNKAIEEQKINKLGVNHPNMVIEDVFDLDEYRILVVANKFQTGFDQPLLSAMFLDKAVNGITAIQTISRLNRKCPDKEQEEILVVDFTNNTSQIFEAFNKHRKGSPFKEREPNENILKEIYQAVIDSKIYTINEIDEYIKAYITAEKQARERKSEADTQLSKINVQYRKICNDKLKTIEEIKKFTSLLNRYSKLYYFIAGFYPLNKTLHDFIIFAEVIPNMLLKKGKKSELMELLKIVELSKGAVTFQGQHINFGKVKSTKKTGLKISINGHETPKSTIEEAIENIKQQFHISNDEAIVIKEICEEVSEKEEIQIRVSENKDNKLFLDTYEPTVQSEVKNGYINREMWNKLDEPIYTDKGGIITLMGKTIIKNIITEVA